MEVVWFEKFKFPPALQISYRRHLCAAALRRFKPFAELPTTVRLGPGQKLKAGRGLGWKCVQMRELDRHWSASYARPREVFDAVLGICHVVTYPEGGVVVPPILPPMPSCFLSRIQSERNEHSDQAVAM